MSPLTAQRKQEGFYLFLIKSIDRTKAIVRTLKPKTHIHTCPSTHAPSSSGQVLAADSGTHPNTASTRFDDHISQDEKRISISKRSVAGLDQCDQLLEQPHPSNKPTDQTHPVIMPCLLSLSLYRNLKPKSTTTPNTPLPSPVTTLVLQAWDKYAFGQSADALTNWLNARWRKSGYEVSRETVYFTLRLNVRDARMGAGVRDPGEGRMWRGRRT